MIWGALFQDTSIFLAYSKNGVSMTPMTIFTHRYMDLEEIIEFNHIQTWT